MRTPVRAAVGDMRVLLTDGSVGGIGLAHHGSLPAPGAICRLEIASDWGPISADCQIVRTVQQVATQTAIPTFQSGLQIVVMDHQSGLRLRELIEATSEDDF